MAKAACRYCLLAFVALFALLPAYAQNSSPEPLVVPFFPVPPFTQYNEQQERSGFSVELARMIGEEIGVEIVFRDVANSKDFVASLASGETQMFPGVARLPALEQSNVFSDIVVNDTLRLIVREDNSERFSTDATTSRRIGIVPPAVGSVVQELLEANDVVEFESPEAAVMGLLTGNVDNLLIPNPVAYSIARQARIDGRISFVGKPIRTVERVVALHESRNELLGPVNEAIALLIANGRLEALRQRYNVIVPPPPPEVLTVGVTDFPPYNIQNDDGTFSGFSVETMRDLAQLAGLQIEFKAISLEEFGVGPSSASFDMLTQSGISAARRETMDFALPIERFEYAIFSRTGESDGLSDLDSLQSRRLGVEAVNLGRRFAEQHGALDIVVFEGRKALLQALENGKVDAIIYPSAAMRLEISRSGLLQDIEEVSPPFRVVERAPALRFGLGEIRERLNAVIPGYIISDDYRLLYEKYFGEPVFWTEPRLYKMAAAFSAVVILLSGVVFWQRQKQRRIVFEQQQHELDLERKHSAELSSLVKQLEFSQREQAEFTYAISHDLKSPSNTIGMLIEELGEIEKLGFEGQGVLQDMSSTNQRMRRLVDDVLVYSRIVDEAVEPEMVDLNKLIDEVKADLAADITSSKARIESTALPVFNGYRTQLKILFQNLISNAIKFRAPDRDPRIIIRSHHYQNVTSISVSDNGIGIPKEHHERIFSLFQRLHDHSTYEGTGMGLTICRRIMSKHNGEIIIDSEVVRGTTFKLTFQTIRHDENYQASAVN